MAYDFSRILLFMMKARLQKLKLVKQAAIVVCYLYNRVVALGVRVCVFEEPPALDLILRLYTKFACLGMIQTIHEEQLTILSCV